ncbi:scarecrow-like protein 3 [Curcuma longa]|uniref:scarecrow-like protein 3 n=1 Tax=Curcuma longa TaxID=136217 RepID=UPI003D9F4911
MCRLRHRFRRQRDHRSTRPPVAPSPPCAERNAGEDHNSAALTERFVEALFYYAALFDCLDSTVPWQSVERLRLEKMLLGEEIKNIIACEGWERKERHEKLEQWARRLNAAVPLGYYALLQARRLLQGFGCDGYKVREEGGGRLMMCWQDRPLFSVSAWRC